MYTRFLTYDLKYAQQDGYSELYDLIHEYDWEKITESTYQIKTDEELEPFMQKFLQVTKPGDNVKVIINTEKGMKVKKIR